MISETQHAQPAAPQRQPAAHRMLRVCWLFVVLGLTAPALLAQDRGDRYGARPQPAPSPTYIVAYVHPDNQAADAHQLVRAWQSEINRQSSFGASASTPVANALWHPVTVQATFNEHPLPVSQPRDGLHPRTQMSHYVTLGYASVSSVSRIVTLLREDPRFGFVDVVDGGWSGAVVNDPYFHRPPTAPDPSFVGFQWGSHMMRFDDVWDWLPGHSNIGVVDAGMLTVHDDLGDAFRAHLSWDYVQSDRDVEPNSGFRGHGSHVAGILAASSNNQDQFGDWEGIAGGCWNCSLMMAKAFQDSRADAIAWLSDNGAQVVNFSGFFGGSGPEDLPAGVPCASFPQPQQHFLCPVLATLALRDVLVVAASGNDLRRVDFPALEPNVVAAGGMEVNGQFWNLTNDGGCPDIDLPGHGSSPQCGSNFGAEQELVAPALNVLSTFYPDATWSLTELNCLDDNFHGEHFPGENGSGYAFCTGTSMSSAFVSAAAALLRSANPLLSADQVRAALIDTASGGGSHSNVFGYGLPDLPDAAQRVMGEVFELPVLTRLTPVFNLYSAQADAWMYTSKPQVASAAIAGLLYETPQVAVGVPFNQAPVGSAVPGYLSFPLEFGPAPAPLSSFSVLSGPRNPFSGNNDLAPLYRLSFADVCSARDHVYTTDQAGIDFFTDTDFCPLTPGIQSFRVDGIEGWVFASCPPGFTCDDADNPAQPQCLHRRGSISADAWALIVERELSEPVYAGYTQTVGNSCIGYVFVNEDSDADGLSDGFELTVGTNHRATDSDCDGLPDGQELPLLALPASDPMNGVACADADIIIQGSSAGQVGQTMNFSITVGNPIGPERAELQVAIDVGALTDQGVDSINAVGGTCDLHPSRENGLYLCQLPSLARSFSTGVSVSVRPSFSGTVSITAELQFPAQPDPYLGNNAAERVLSITP